MSPATAGAAAGRGGSPRPRRVLIIGYGNSLRRDDGAGVVAAQMLAADPRLASGDVEVQQRYQLLPEMALDMAEATLVILVDADLRGLPGSIEIHPIDPAVTPRSDADARREPGASSHHVGGGELVALAASLTGRRPEAMAIGISVADTGLGEGLSPAVEAALPRIVEIVVDLVATHRTR